MVLAIRSSPLFSFFHDKLWMGMHPAADGSDLISRSFDFRILSSYRAFLTSESVPLRGWPLRCLRPIPAGDIPALPASWNLVLERVTWRSKHIDLENRPSVKPQVPCSRVALSSLVQSQKRTAIIDGEAAAPYCSRNDSDAGSTKQPDKKLCTAGLNVMSRDCCSVGSSMSRCAQLVLRTY